MRKNKSYLSKVVSSVLVLAMTATYLPGTTLAADVAEETQEPVEMTSPDTQMTSLAQLEESADNEMTELGMDLEKEVNPSNDIPAYQPKDFWSTTKVTPKPINIVEFTSKNKVTEIVKFDLFNSTLQKEMGDVVSKNGVLQLPELIVDHNYILFPADLKYRMVMSDGKPEVSAKSVNMYFWVKPDGTLMDIKMGVSDSNKDGYADTYNYPEMTDIYMRARAAGSENPTEDRRASISIPVQTEGGGPLFNKQFKLISDRETIEVKSAGSGKANLVAELLEDVDYTLIVEDDTYDIEAFPIAIKDKSEYTSADGGTRGGTYPYNHADCNRVDAIKLKPKEDAHSLDKIIESPDKDVSISGRYFGDIIVRTDTYDIKGEDERFSGVNGTAIDFYTINNHRWEIANLSGPTFKVTVKSIIPAESIKRVYLCNPTDVKSKEITYRKTSDPYEIEFDTTALGTSTIALEYEISLIAQSKIDEVNKKLSDEEKRHTVATFKPFSDAATELERVLEESSSSQDEIKAAYDKLIEAENQLELKLSDTTRTAITDAKTARDKLDSTEYTESSWKNYSDAVEAALKIAVSEDPGEKAGTAALAKIETAKKALTLKPAKNGWVKVDGKYYYYVNNKVVTKWKKIDKVWYYFTDKGVMVTGWKQVGKIWYYFKSSGAMATGWQKVKTSWYYFTKDGAMLTGWQKIGSKWYYFKTGGAMATGWLKIGSKWYYFDGGGVMVTGQKKIGGKWYRFNSNGVWVK